ncbi:MAG TPA: tRNA (adenosine(37)-N6)-dimethylallyltransferase MiaA [Candidatus Goldiibacteriota bacterium]|nr:tRNA (adenosine(37)-N6)-dimethylallyltransferase MiaA [Candidatus Goldiibacteriota bacterium]
MFIVIAGATATGKSAVAVELCKIMDAEIVSADSMQVYRRMDIGTGKLSKAQMAGIRHHMIDIAEPYELFSAAAYKKMAESAMDDIKKRGKTPVIAGGTGLYIDAVLKGIMKAAEPDEGLKKALRAELAEKGLDFLCERLKELDPSAAETTDLKNSRRVLRALELIMANGVKMAELRSRTKETAYKDEYKMFVLSLNREELYKRIGKRVDDMISAGLVDEVKGLLGEGNAFAHTAAQAIGYKEIISHLEGKCSLAEAVEAIKQATRNYAKRQETWFKRDKDAVFLRVEGKSAGEIAGEIQLQISNYKFQIKEG